MNGCMSSGYLFTLLSILSLRFICYHTVNGKTIPIMHGKYTTKTAAERKKRMILAGKTNKKK